MTLASILIASAARDPEHVAAKLEDELSDADGPTGKMLTRAPKPPQDA